MSMEGSAGFWVRVWKEKANDRSWDGLKEAMVIRFETVNERSTIFKRNGAVDEFVQDPNILEDRTKKVADEQLLVESGAGPNGIGRPNDMNGSEASLRPNGLDNRNRTVRNLPYPKFLKRWSLRVKLLAEDEEDDIGDGEEQETKPMEFLVWSVEGLTPPKTMKWTGLIGESRVVVLIDSGASHNFISRKVVEELELPVVVTPSHTVSLGDGHKMVTSGRWEKIQIRLGDATVEEELYVFELAGVDVILGIAWLAKVGKLMINWGEMSMEYMLKGKKVTIKEDPALSHQLEEPKALLKLVEVESWVLVWDWGKVEQEECDEWRGDLTAKQKVELWSVLQTHYLGFRERESLPPLPNIKHVYRKKFKTWKLGLIERKRSMARRYLETGGGRPKNNPTEENYIAHESSNIHEVDTHWTSWLVPMWWLLILLFFVISMDLNNCLKNNFGPQCGCVAKFLGGFSFEPMQENWFSFEAMQENSLLSLTEMGALGWDSAGNGHQGWRLDTCMLY
ncbi:uncharacterized protein LOC111241148 [Vigna radiata var. radiata]|uniref:Uncharacterized protein LOC111241148 n=1 Tax=Vigna radiata var. radiata TaxID=3916 RepID=A0A3Q0ERM6_VIGRR|nr:uncharacterized protein LOC111241148 [Vigna radiata var. radiata]